MSSSLQVLLATSLATETSALATLPASLSLLTLDRTIARAESENAAAILHKWTLRLSSLINGPQDSLGRAAGLALAVETSRQSEGIFLAQGKGWTNAALSALSHAGGSSRTHDSALTFLAFSLLEARRLPEFARDVFRPDVLKQLCRDLCSLASGQAADQALRIRSLNLVTLLFQHHAITLRPIAHPSPTGADRAPSIQDILVALLCQADCPPALSSAATRTFAHLWLTAGKKDGSTRWRQTVEALIGSMHVAFSAVARTFIEEFDVSPPAPLGLPPVVATSTTASSFPNAMDTIAANMQRLAVLERIFLAMIGSSTERPVAIPIGTISQLLLRLFALSTNNKQRDVADPELRPAELYNLAQLHLFGCRLIAQLAAVLGSRLSPHVNRLLTFLCHQLELYSSSSATHSSLLATAVLLVDAAPFEPKEGARQLSVIMQALLAGIAPLIVRPELPASTTKANGTESIRKAKRAKFEVDQAFAHRVPVSAMTLATAEHALTSLDRLLRSASAAFIPSNQLNLSFRLLLALTSHPSFSNMYASTSVHAEPLDYALSARPDLHIALLRPLVASIPLAGRDAGGLLERAIGIFQLASGSGDVQVAAVASEGLAATEMLVHPRVPPLLLSAGARRALGENVGGEVRMEIEDVVEAEGEEIEAEVAMEEEVATAVEEEAVESLPEKTAASIFSFTAPAPVEPIATVPFKPATQPAAVKAASPVRIFEPASDSDEEPMPTIDLGLSDEDEEMVEGR